MVQMRSDRRVGRTRRRLKEALLELINARDYDAISIHDITERADVGRSTFYSHFASKDELLFSGFDEWLLSLADAPPSHASEAASDRRGAVRLRFSLPLLEHLRTQRRFVLATIADARDAGLQRKTTALLAEVVRRELARISGRAARATAKRGARVAAERLQEAQAHCVVGAFLGLAAWWLKEGQGLSAEEVDEVFQGVALSRGTEVPSSR